MAATLLIWGCKKEEEKAYFNGGKAPELSTTATAVNMKPIDSTKTVVSFNWSDPAYSFSTGSNTLNVTHTLEIDSVGRNFSKPQVFSSNNVLQASLDKNFVRSFTGEEFNNLLLKLGLKAGTTYNIEARVSSQLYVGSTKLTSNVITMAVTPYTTEPQPLYPVPANLFIVGGATPGGWNNPVPAPAQQFTKIDKNTFGIIISLKAGEKYLLLPENGSWSSKYAVADNSKPEASTGTSFVVNSGQDIPAPATDGLYKIIVDFVTGKYTVTAVDPTTIPAGLYIVGSATPGGWNNPVPTPSQQFTKTSAYTYELVLPLKKGEFYLLLPVNGSWDSKFAIQDKTNAAFKLGGALKVNSGEDIPAPDEDGTYKIEVNFLTMSYKVTKQ